MKFLLKQNSTKVSKKHGQQFFLEDMINANI
jgi:hypothetical protein